MQHDACRLLQAAYLLLAALLEAALDDFARQEQQTLHCAQAYKYCLPLRWSARSPVPVQMWQG